MTTDHFTRLSPEDTQTHKAKLALVNEYWKGVWECGDSGGTTWDVLEDLYHQVEDSLAQYRARPRYSFLEKAVWLTAEAEFLRAGGRP